MSEARYLPVLDTEGRLCETAPLLLLSRMIFPNDAYSAGVLVDTLQNESSHDSHIARLLTNSFKREAMQAKSAGELVRLLAELSAHGFPSSQNRAVALAVKFGGDTDEKLKAGYPVSKSTILQHFHNYKDVAHLWAAAGHVGDMFLKLLESTEGLETFLAIAEKYQRCLTEDVQQSVSNWNPWKVPVQFAQPELALAIPHWNTEYLDAAKGYTKRGGN